MGSTFFIIVAFMQARIPNILEDCLGHLTHHFLYAFRQEFTRRSSKQGFDISLEDIGVLVLLNTEEGLKQTQLSEKLGKDKSIITRTLNKLDNSGYVIRRQDKTDRRIFRSYLTKSGKQLLTSMKPIINNLIQFAHKDVSQTDYDTTRKVLRQIIDNLKI